MREGRRQTLMVRVFKISKDRQRYDELLEERMTMNADQICHLMKLCLTTYSILMVSLISKRKNNLPPSPILTKWKEWEWFYQYTPHWLLRMCTTSTVYTRESDSLWWCKEEDIGFSVCYCNEKGILTIVTLVSHKPTCTFKSNCHYSAKTRDHCLLQGKGYQCLIRVCSIWGVNWELHQCSQLYQIPWCV